MDINKLKELLKKTWSIETSAWPDNWSKDNSAWGQCVATALIVQDYFEGEILRANITGIGPHCWNRLLNGAEVDLTRGQFPEGTAIPKGEVIPREMFTKDSDVLERYKILKTKIDFLGKKK